MVDFNGNEIKIGSKIFWLHKLSEPVIGIVSNIDSKKYILVRFIDVIKFSKNGEKWFNEYKEINEFDNPKTLDDAGYIVKCDTCVVLV